MASTSSNPWEEPLDESYWRTLLTEVECIASPVQPSSPDHQTDIWSEDSAGDRGSRRVFRVQVRYKSVHPRALRLMRLTGK